MSPGLQGGIVLLVTLAVLLSGTPVAFGLGAVSIAFIVIFQGFDALHVVAETLYAGLNDFTLVSIPMFVMMGAAIGSSPAGKDLYLALDRWLYRLPGGLAISNLGACALFAALTGILAGVLRRNRQDGHSGNAKPWLSGRCRHGVDLRWRHARYPDSTVDNVHPLRHCHRDLNRPPVSRRRAARTDADGPVHPVDSVYHLEARISVARGGLPLYVAGEI